MSEDHAGNLKKLVTALTDAIKQYGDPINHPETDWAAVEKARANVILALEQNPSLRPHTKKQE